MIAFFSFLSSSGQKSPTFSRRPVKPLLNRGQGSGSRWLVLNMLNILLTMCFTCFYMAKIMTAPPVDPPLLRKDWSLRRPAPLPSVSDPHCTHRDTIAILIAGQRDRFTFLENSDMPLLDTTNYVCEPLIDVFIVLGVGTISKPWTGVVSSPPYAQEATAENLERIYQARGARNVRVKFVDDEEEFKMAQEAIAAVNATDDTEGSKFAAIQKWYDFRWYPTIRQYYMRHLAYAMAVQQDTEYHAITFWREDNMFFEPLRIPQVISDPDDKGVFYVDEYCSFAYYSDKMYVLNTRAANTMFDPSYKDFIAKMGRWSDFATEMASFSLVDPFQPEAFREHLMKGAKVITADFHRADVRYVDGRLCVPNLYWRCTPELNRQSEIHVCNSPLKEPLVYLGAVGADFVFGSGLFYTTKHEENM